jgi:hypothetical protein
MFVAVAPADGNNCPDAILQHPKINKRFSNLVFMLAASRPYLRYLFRLDHAQKTSPDCNKERQISSQKQWLLTFVFKQTY